MPRRYYYKRGDEPEMPACVAFDGCIVINGAERQE